MCQSDETDEGAHLIRNTVCPYCRRKMVKAENLDLSRSVEHLIPNAALTRKRKNDEGDFYACRQCNSRKSKIDYVLGVATKSQSRDEALATATLLRAATRDGHMSDRFVDAINSATGDGEWVYMNFPISGTELLEYIQFLGRGQYFKAFGVPFDPKKHVMLVDFSNKQVHHSLETSYEGKLGSNPYRDLERNPFSEVISEGECLIWSKDHDFLFIFHDYTSISIRIKVRDLDSSLREIEMNQRLLEDFPEYAGQGSDA